MATKQAVLFATVGGCTIDTPLKALEKISLSWRASDEDWTLEAASAVDVEDDVDAAVSSADASLSIVGAGESIPRAVLALPLELLIEVLLDEDEPWSAIAAGDGVQSTVVAVLALPLERIALSEGAEVEPTVGNDVATAGLSVEAVSGSSSMGAGMVSAARAGKGESVSGDSVIRWCK